MSLDPDEIEQRLPVWHAFSLMFLAARPGERRHRASNRRIARRLAILPYSERELRRIFNQDVLPAFWPDTFDDWADWRPSTPDQVRSIVLNPRPDTRTRFERFLSWLIYEPELRSVLRQVRRFRRRPSRS